MIMERIEMNKGPHGSALPVPQATYAFKNITRWFLLSHSVMALEIKM